MAVAEARWLQLEALPSPLRWRLSVPISDDDDDDDGSTTVGAVPTNNHENDVAPSTANHPDHECRRRAGISCQSSGGLNPVIDDDSLDLDSRKAEAPPTHESSVASVAASAATAVPCQVWLDDVSCAAWLPATHDTALHSDERRCTSAEPSSSLLVDRRRRLLQSQRQQLLGIYRRLHQALVDGASLSDVQAILRLDAGAISRSVSLTTERQVYCPVLRRHVTRTAREQHTYPLHLALAKGAHPPIIEALIDADPSVLLVRDGPQRDTPLLVLLKARQSSSLCDHRHPRAMVDLVDRMLLEVPFCASVVDRHGNTPLHAAASRSASLEVVQHLCILYPEALGLPNGQGKLPHELARWRGTHIAGDAVSDYLWEQHNLMYMALHHEPPKLTSNASGSPPVES